MTIRIERETHRLNTMIRVSGRLQSTHLEELKAQLEGARSRIALDLNGVTLVDVEIVRFLNACEKGGVELLHCWPYIQEWMTREKDWKG
jgi:anti-anti-sigma regulatory factor